ncbi:hypothetical protein DFR52_103797 [Hoeflea marina]|uniref:Uncharacterized protein n=1 Tax=Hoeflea marina TaxID=274592 RepID=A0A317PKM9_9HYPH|nr:hypothetical protein [Hoeflea marina]PWW00590.1 hypothetical protein DFR52_103797 [Hoeflea marina]
MNRLISILAGVGLLAVTLAGLGLALVIGLLGAMTFGMVRLMRPKPVYARRVPPRDTEQAGHAQPYRVWNDGRGTIIDM